MDGASGSTDSQLLKPQVDLSALLSELPLKYKLWAFFNKAILLFCRPQEKNCNSIKVIITTQMFACCHRVASSLCCVGGSLKRRNSSKSLELIRLTQRRDTHIILTSATVRSNQKILLERYHVSCDIYPSSQQQLEIQQKQYALEDKLPCLL